MTMKMSKIEYYRIEKGLTNRELARLAGISESMLLMIRKSERSPSFKIMCSIADVLGVPVDELREDKKD
jgi:transcriptional regulator with XRE-family HTH domain